MKKLSLLLSFIYVAHANAQCPPTPTLTANNNTNYCVGTSIQNLTVTGTDTINWYSDANLITNVAANTNTYTPTGLPVGTTSFYVTATANGCVSASQQIIINIYPTPTVSINVPISNVCLPQCATITPSVSSQTVITLFAWDFGDGSNSTAANPGQHCYSNMGMSIVTLTVTDANGCSSVATNSVFVNAPPVINVSATSNTICAGSTLTLTATGATTYTWAPIGSIAASPVIISGATTTYTVWGSDGTCTGSNTITITANPTPIISIQSNNVSCNAMCDGTATLSVNGGTNPYMFNWAGVANQPVNSGLCPGTYTCNVTDSNGCKDSTSVTIAQPPPIVATFTLVQDTAPHVWNAYPTFTGGSGPYTYTWNWGDGLMSNGAYPSHSYSVAGTYSICVTLSDANGCVATYCQNDAVYRLGNNSTYSSMVKVNVINGLPGAFLYQKLLADTVTEFDVTTICMLTLKQQNSTQQTQSNCINIGNAYGGFDIWLAKGDSVYNGKTYKKVSHNAQFSNPIFQGLMREDTVAKKVYFIQYCNTNEELLYNFSLLTGDTITYNFPNAGANMVSGIYTVDSVRIKHDFQTFYRKHFLFKKSHRTK